MRQGEVSCKITASGTRTSFGQTAGLVRTPSASSQMHRRIFPILKRLVAFTLGLVMLIAL